MVVFAFTRCLYLLLSTLFPIIVALPQPCTYPKPPTTLSNPRITACSPTSNLTTPAPPFPELYALLHLDTSAFIHIKYVWSPLTPLQIHTYHILARNLQTSLANTIRGHGDIKLPDKGVAKELERLEYRIYPVPSRRYEVRYSVVQAAIRGVAALFRIYGFYEVEVGIHMFEYVEDRPDGYMVLIIDEDSPSREVSRI